MLLLSAFPFLQSKLFDNHHSKNHLPPSISPHLFPEHSSYTFSFPVLRFLVYLLHSLFVHSSSDLYFLRLLTYCPAYIVTHTTTFRARNIRTWTSRRLWSRSIINSTKTSLTRYQSSFFLSSFDGTFRPEGFTIR